MSTHIRTFQPGALRVVCFFRQGGFRVEGLELKPSTLSPVMPSEICNCKANLDFKEIGPCIRNSEPKPE